MIINFTIVSYPSLSARKPDFQAFVVSTPNFTHKNPYRQGATAPLQIFYRVPIDGD